MKKRNRYLRFNTKNLTIADNVATQGGASMDLEWRMSLEIKFIERMESMQAWSMCQSFISNFFVYPTTEFLNFIQLPHSNMECNY